MFRHQKTTVTLIFALLSLPLATACRHEAHMATPPREKVPYFGFAFNYPYGLPEMRIRVHSVIPDTPAQASGLLPDDSITALDGKRDFKTAYEVLDYLSRKPVGSVLRLDIVRNGAQLSISIVAVEANEAQQASIVRNLEKSKAEQELVRKRK